MLRAAGVAQSTNRKIEKWVAPERGLVWLFAAPRSGTTWVYEMLDAHPLVRAINEPLIGAHLGVAHSVVAEAPGGTERLLYDAMRAKSDYVLSDSRDWTGPMVDLVRRRYLLPNADVVRGGGCVLLKEPHGSEAARLLHAMMPASRAIVLVRDPRDCLDSVLDIVEAGWMGGEGRGALPAAERMAVMQRVGTNLRLRMRESLALHDSLPASQQILYRYEDLLADPAAHLTTLVTRLGLPTSADWVNKTIGATAFDAKPADRRGSGQFHRAASPGLWRSHFSADETKWANDFFADVLSRFAYDA